jgi:peptide/nickel transport system substrate-binding protein
VDKSYWSRVLEQRTLNRRRLLKGAAGIAAGGAALSLIGCGGGGDEGSGVKGDASGFLSKPEETTKNAKAGGTWPHYFAEDVINMDPLLNNATPTFPQLSPVYSFLLKGGVSPTGRPGPDAISGDAAESWELTPDGTQITLKLRANHKFDPRPPTNGRAMTSEDVKWSWDKFASQGPSAADLAYSRNEAAPIETVTTPDARTIVMKMKFPYGPVTELLQSQQHFFLEPRDDNFNFKGDMRGSGPYFLESFRPSSGITYSKNPDWYDKPRPFFDKIERTLISDYAQGLAQFRSKNLWQFAVRAEDILSTKRDNPEMVMYAGREYDQGVSYINYSKRPDSVFADVRIRRALSMTLDRDLLADVFYNLVQFRDAGLPTEAVWNSHLPAGYAEWVDPRGTGLGEGAKYFTYNLAEAKKLIDAAGVKTPIKETFGSWTDRAFEQVKQHEVTNAMFNDSQLFQMEWRPLIYNTTWRTEDDSGGTAYTGLLSSRLAGFSPDVYVVQKYTPTGRSKVSAQPVPGVTDLVLKQRLEPDPKKRAAIFAELQKNAAMEWPDIPAPMTNFPGFSLRWPWLSNHGVLIEGNASARAYTYYWYDESKKV